MALPRVDVPTYELTLPSEDKKIKFRPFLVKEEKILYIALETGDNKQMVDALKEVIKACTFDVLKVDQLPIFDVEYIFLNIRARSISEIVNLQYKCNNTVANEETKEEKECGNVIKIELNVLEIEPIKQEDKWSHIY